MTQINYVPIEEVSKRPVCPHCEKDIEEVHYFEQTGIIRMKVIRLFVCPHCLKVLGTGMVGM